MERMELLCPGIPIDPLGISNLAVEPGAIFKADVFIACSSFLPSTPSVFYKVGYNFLILTAMCFTLDTGA